MTVTLSVTGQAWLWVLAGGLPSMRIDNYIPATRLAYRLLQPPQFIHVYGESEFHSGLPTNIHLRYAAARREFGR